MFFWRHLQGGTDRAPQISCRDQKGTACLQEERGSRAVRWNIRRVHGDPLYIYHFLMAPTYGSNLSQLEMRNSDTHWWLENRKLVLPQPRLHPFEGILEPHVIQRARWRPRAGQPLSPTRRNCSNFEVEGAVLASAQRQGLCRLRQAFAVQTIPAMQPAVPMTQMVADAIAPVPNQTAEDCSPALLSLREFQELQHQHQGGY